MVTVQVGSVPLQPPPLQPKNVAPGCGIALRVTVAPEAYVVLQVLPQLILGVGSLLTTVPKSEHVLPVPQSVSVEQVVVLLLEHTPGLSTLKVGAE